MAKRKKKPKTARIGRDRPSVDKATTNEFIEKNFVVAPEMQRAIREGETTEELIKGLRWLTPLDVLEIYSNDPRTPTKHRIEAAKAAAPYKHRKMPQAVELSGKLTLAQLVASASRPPK